MFRLRSRLQGSGAPGKGARGKVVVVAPVNPGALEVAEKIVEKYLDFFLKTKHCVLWQAILVRELGVATKDEAKEMVRQRLASIQNVVLDDDGALLILLFLPLDKEKIKNNLFGQEMTSQVVGAHLILSSTPSRKWWRLGNATAFPSVWWM